MQLNNEGLKNTAWWTDHAYRLPRFDRSAMAEKTMQAPRWVHFGAGNIFRAFQAHCAQTLLDEGAADTGLIAAEGYDPELPERIFHPHDNLNVLVTLKADGTLEKTVIGSIAAALRADPAFHEDWAALTRAFEYPGLQMASFTITEKGYHLTGADGACLPDVACDMVSGPAHPVSYMGKVASLLYTRYLAGRLPLAMVSMDNCSHNGDKLRDAMFAMADGWVKNGCADEGFADYVRNGRLVSFPWTMIDKITPRPDAVVEKTLTEDGLADMAPIVTARHTYAAPFVNAEECEYLVIEDDFPNGHPALDKSGVLFADRETVDKVEKMKVCTCLNPLHTALAVFGCLMGFERIADEMRDEDLRRMVDILGYAEGLPVVVDPGAIRPKAFIDAVVNVRLPNPFMPDTPQRIATDTSQKLSIRFGETVKAYLRSDTLRVDTLRVIPLVFAGWLRYLTGLNDAGQPFTLSPDPLLETLRSRVDTLRLGDNPGLKEAVAPILRDETIFGVDLFQIGLAEKVIALLADMLSAPGAVRNTLHRVVSEA